MKSYWLPLAILFWLIANNLYAQKEPEITHPPIKALIAAGDSCDNAGGNYCTNLFAKAVQLGAKQKVSYLFFLEYKAAQSFAKSGKWQIALAYTNQALSHTKHQEEQLILMNLKSFIFYNEGNSDSSMAYMIAISNILEQRKDTAKLAYTYLNLGNIFYALDNKVQSVKYLVKSYHLLAAIKDTINLVNAAGNVADGYLSINDTTKALEWSYKTLGLKDYVHDREGRIIALKTLAKIKWKNETDSAISIMQTAINLTKSIKDRQQLGNLYGIYAQLLAEINKGQMAQHYADEAVALHRAFNFVPGLADNLYIAATVSLNNKHYEKAAHYFLEAKGLNDSLKSEKRLRIINELSTKYETEKKEKLLAQQALTIQKSRWQMAIIIAVLVLVVLIAVMYQKVKSAQQQKILQEKENAILKAQMIGEERERGRISKDLHDGVAAMLGAAKMSVQAVPFLTAEKQQEQLVKVAQILEDTHADIRRIAHDLLPVTLEKEGLLAALKQFAEDVSQTDLLTVKVMHDVPLSLQLKKQTELMLFRIVQELINNVMKHSQASEATIQLFVADNNMNIIVADNGAGFVENREHQGLYSIRERLQAIGGNFNIGSNSNKGTIASLSISLGVR